MAAPELNRRDRRSARTRREIVRAATELVLEEGYERATITRIAERADLATRTVTTRFPSKEDIFFEGTEVVIAVAERHLREGDGDVVARLRAWIEEMKELAGVEKEDPEIRLLRSRAIKKDPDLRALMVQHFDRAHIAIASAVAADTGRAPEDPGPQMIAAATIALLSTAEAIAAEDESRVLPELERGFAVLQAALDAVQCSPAPPTARGSPTNSTARTRRRHCCCCKGRRTRIPGGRGCANRSHSTSARSPSTTAAPATPSANWASGRAPRSPPTPAAVLDHLGYAGADVYGTSMGGRIAQMLALDGRVRRLVLACTTPGGPHAKERSQEVRRALMQRDNRAALLDLMYTPAYAAEHGDESTLLGDPGMSREASRQHLRVSGRHDAYDALPRITAPTLVLHGSDDQMAPVENAHVLAYRIPEAKLRITPRGRHGFFEEFAASVNPEIFAFLRPAP